jgi:large subunit ribosomal protein L4
MTKIAVYNLKGEKVKDLEINKDIFNIVIIKTLIHLVYVALRANIRQLWAHTKDRSEVRGGGRKPWKQKGTGRARHGSNRSPIWSGGGVTFGPTNLRNYRQKINKKMNKKAVAMCLTDKFASEKVFLFEDFNNNELKTKDFEKILKKLEILAKKSIIVSNDAKQKFLAARNIEGLEFVRASDINVLDLLNNKNLILDLKSLEILENRLVKN